MATNSCLYCLQEECKDTCLRLPDMFYYHSDGRKTRCEVGDAEMVNKSLPTSISLVTASNRFQAEITLFRPSFNDGREAEKVSPFQLLKTRSNVRVLLKV